MSHSEKWYMALADRLGHRGYTTLDEVLAAEKRNETYIDDGYGGVAWVPLPYQEDEQ